jgi:structural maintenance of chromosome 3 (chondroitin sulfate proteoglycan 6)
MRIRRVTVHGFKSYEDTVVFGPFSPGQNALVGLNGTGKSNFYSAIGFVLLDEYAHIRVTERKGLLHEGHAKNSMTAFVEIIFDNVNRLIPIDTDEVSIRRSIGIKKDEYFVDRKNSTRQDVHNLLESCGFSPASGYYIVRQGRINALALMKDSDRLDLLMDVAGTKFYDQQREESLKMIDESEGRTEKIRESLGYIRERLRQLEDEKAELELHEQLDRERRAVEFLLQKRELHSIREELQVREQELEQETLSGEEDRKRLSGLRQSIKGGQSQLNELKEREQRVNAEKDRIEKKNTKAIREKTRAEYEARELEDKRIHSDQLRADLNTKLEHLDFQITDTESRLARTTAQLDEISDLKAAVEGEFDGLQQVLGGKIEDPTATQNELARTQTILSSLREEENQLAEDIRQTQTRHDSLLQKQSTIEEQLAEGVTENRTAVQTRNHLMNERKEQWKEEARIEHDLKKVQSHIGKLRAKMDTSIPAQIASGLQALKDFHVDGCHGPLIDHISCDPELNTALSVVAKARLFNVIIDTDDSAEIVIKRLRESNRGRLTFMALNCLSTDNFEMPEGVTPLISSIRFDPKFRPAIANVFGKIALADSLRDGVLLSTQHNVSCVTREGDFVNCHGPMTGGSRAHRKSPLDLAVLLTQREVQEEELTGQLHIVRQRLAEIEQQIQVATKRLNIVEVTRSKVESERSELSLEIQSITEELSAKNQQLEERHRRVQTTERRILSIEKRLASIQEFNSRAGGDVITQSEDLRRRKEQLARQHLALLTEKLEFASQLNDRLIPRRKRTFDEISRLDSDAIGQRLAEVEGIIEVVNQRLAAAVSRGQELDEELIERANTINAVEENLLRQQREEERLQRTVQNQSKGIESIMARVGLLKQREEECLKLQKDIEPFPEAQIAEKEHFTGSDLRRQLANINTEAKRYRHVNKKAIEQYRAFSVEQEDLEQRESELTHSAESIKSLIQTLDTRKEEAIARTFAQISDNFSHIFAQLEPSATGTLVLQRDEEQGMYTGVAIRVRFDGQLEIASLAQLSGGQKALVALTLVFAIQKFAPAPFYLFDEVDSALDQKYRCAVAEVIHTVCHPEDGSDAAQVIFTTFKPELLEQCDSYFAVRYDRGRSTVVNIHAEDARAIVAEQKEPEDE